MAVLRPINPSVNPTDMHLNANPSPPPATITVVSASINLKICTLTHKLCLFRLSCSFFTSSHVSHVPPTYTLNPTQSGENHQQQSGNQGKRRSSFSSSDSDRTKPLVSLKRTGSSKQIQSFCQRHISVPPVRLRLMYYTLGLFDTYSVPNHSLDSFSFCKYHPFCPFPSMFFTLSFHYIIPLDCPLSFATSCHSGNWHPGADDYLSAPLLVHTPHQRARTPQG